jgi:predicted DNA-binding protein (MmcQ/YjbR family)
MNVESVRERISKLCLAHPEATSEPFGDHTTFKIKKKVFAYFLNNHHGDGIISVLVKVAPGENAKLSTSEPDLFYLPAYVARHGYVGMRLDTKKVDWDRVSRFVDGSYLATAKPRSSRGTPRQRPSKGRARAPRSR